MNPSKSEILSLHKSYCELTMQEGLPLRFDRERWWYEWCQYGFTLDDLKLVIRHLKKGINDGRRNQGALKFSNLICQPDRFEEDLYEAKRVFNTRKARPTHILTEQRIDGIHRQVEIPAPDPTVDIGQIFRKYRKEFSKKNEES